MRVNRPRAITGLARALLLFGLVMAFVGCSASEFSVSPSLNPRDSRIFTVRTAAFMDGRECRVYVPPGYPALHRRYPVLYVHDGESAFDARTTPAGSFGFDVTAEAMIDRGEIEPLIIVAITSGGLRFRDYMPTFIGPEGVVDSSSTGGAYLKAIRDRLKPYIDRSFATDPVAARTGISGFSLGGLISVCALYDDPETFGIAGGFSGSYGRGFLSWVEREGRSPGTSLWIDTGLIDDNDLPARALDAIARDQGYQPGVDYEYREIAEGDHSILSVRQRVPAFLSFFSRRSGRPGSGVAALAITPRLLR